MIRRRQLLGFSVIGLMVTAGFPVWSHAEEDGVGESEKEAETGRADNAETVHKTDAEPQTYGPPSDLPDENGPKKSDQKGQGRTAGADYEGRKPDRGGGILGGNIRVRGGSSSRSRIGGSIRIRTGD